MAGKLKRPWKWTRRRLSAALHVARGELTRKEICRKAKTRIPTLWEWQQAPEFQARVEMLRERLGEEAERFEIGIQQRRLKAKCERWLALEKAIEAWKADPTDPAMLAALGGVKGLKVMLEEMRALEKEAAIEAGQWVEKKDVRKRVKQTVSVNLSVPAGVANLSAADLEMIRVLRERLAAAAAAQQALPAPVSTVPAGGPGGAAGGPQRLLPPGQP